MLLPHLAGVVLEKIERTGEVLRLVARCRAATVPCPGCGTAASRVHGRYRRRLADAAVAGSRVVVDLLVRRFRCEQAGCAAVTFAEQVDGLTSPYARYTPLANGMLEAIGLALAGRAGARLAGQLGFAAGRDTLLRRVRALPDPEVGVVRVLGVDDFALRRGHVYGTVLVDMDSHRPVDVLSDREAEAFTAWLRAHPGTEVICRDRSGAYAAGARTGAPDAIQVADRFHLWQNLGDAIEKAVTVHRGALAEPPPPPDDEAEPDVPAAAGAPPPVLTAPPEMPVVTRTRARYTDVQKLLAEGHSRAAVSRTLHLNVRTVRRFADAGSVEELVVKSVERTSKVDRFVEHLHRRWNEGATDAARLTEEVVALGYTGSARSVRRYLQRFRDAQPTPKAGPKPPTVRDTTRWIMTRPDRLGDDDTTTLRTIRARSGDLDRLTEHVADFARMATNLEGSRLEAWISAVEADTLPALTSFAGGLRRDFDAVTAGLTLSHSSGAVEGNVNRIKMIKRQMYGRANFDLLRKRVLLAR